MKIQLRWKDCDRSKAVESSIQDALASLDKYHFLNENVKGEIVYYPKTKLFKVRINVDVRGGKILRTEASSNNIHTATNLALDKMEDQLRRVKTQKRTRTGRKTKGIKYLDIK